MMKRETWRQLIQIIITILTAISSTVLVQSCGLFPDFGDASPCSHMRQLANSGNFGYARQ